MGPQNGEIVPPLGFDPRQSDPLKGGTKIGSGGTAHIVERLERREGSPADI